MHNETYGNYSVLSKISSGSFGTVFKVIDNDENVYACKVEEPTKISQLSYEISLYKYIEKHKSMHKYFCSVIDYGLQRKAKYMILTLGDVDLNNLEKNIGVQQRLQYIRNALQCVQAFHQLGYLHRDLKPSNFVLTENQTRVKLIDLGLAKRYLAKNTDEHIHCIHKTSQVGTLRYNSKYCMSYVQSSRRDDIISFVYTACSILKIKLPWQSLPHEIDSISDTEKKKKAKQEFVLSLKRIVSAKKVCNSIQSLTKILINASNLRFDERPNYEAYLHVIDKDIQ